jgi:hypothetical protein
MSGEGSGGQPAAARRRCPPPAVDREIQRVQATRFRFVHAGSLTRLFAGITLHPQGTRRARAIPQSSRRRRGEKRRVAERERSGQAGKRVDSSAALQGVTI